jgi:CelD/BcsL family acetyltransferase involved in cellulose biosynthesis
MAEIVEINDPAYLARHRLAWASLHAQTREASFFHTLDWLACYWKFYGEAQRLRVLLVHCGGSPIGIVPLVVRREATRLGELRVLTYPLHDWGWFYGPIGPNPAATLTAALKYVRETPRDWDLLDLRWVDVDRIDHGRTQLAMQNAGFAATRGVWKQTAIVDTSTSWESFFASKTTKFRNNQRRYEKRVAELGDVTFERYRPRGAAHGGDDDPRWDLYDDAEAVAQRTWQADATDGDTISSAKVRDFFRETYALAVKNGMADLCLMRAGDRPIALGYNYVHDGYVLGIRFGYDAEFAKSGLGNVMYLNMFRDSFARGDRTFDMGVGSLDIKQPWLTQLVNSYRVTHYPLASPRSQLLRLKHWWSGRVVRSNRLQPVSKHSAS